MLLNVNGEFNLLKESFKPLILYRAALSLLLYCRLLVFDVN
jgi:hypothetical protein